MISDDCPNISIASIAFVFCNFFSYFNWIYTKSFGSISANIGTPPHAMIQKKQADMVHGLNITSSPCLIPAAPIIVTKPEVQEFIVIYFYFEIFFNFLSNFSTYLPPVKAFLGSATKFESTPESIILFTIFFL